MSDLRYCSCLPQVRFLDTRDHAPGCAYTRIAELEARELGWLTTLSTMELEKRELEAENQRLHAGIANAMLCDSVVQMHECLAALMGGGENG